MRSKLNGVTELIKLNHFLIRINFTFVIDRIVFQFSLLQVLNYDQTKCKTEDVRWNKEFN